VLTLLFGFGSFVSSILEHCRYCICNLQGCIGNLVISNVKSFSKMRHPCSIFVSLVVFLCIFHLYFFLIKVQSFSSNEVSVCFCQTNKERKASFLSLGILTLFEHFFDFDYFLRFFINLSDQFQLLHHSVDLDL